MRSFAVLVVLGGCGRIAFDDLATRDAADAAAADALPSCVRDGFEQGLGAWQSVVGAFGVRTAGGPDGSSAIGTQNNSNENLVTHPALAGIAAARVEVDFAIDNATTGDFNIMFLTGALGPLEDGYEVGLFPPTGDNPADEIGVQQNRGLYLIGQHAPTLAASAWHHVAVVRSRDGSFRVDLDGTPYMTSPADATFSAPFTIALRMFNQGRIDNVSVDCAP